ncbi:MAG: ROK family protein [Acidimicrobiales bacterium]
MSAVPVCLAVDVGGTKLAAGLVSAEGQVLGWDRVATPTGGQEVVFSALTGLIETVRRRFPAEVDRCGVGSGGPMTRGGETVSPINIPGWRGFPLRSRLAERTGLSVVVDNDAKALALAEGWQGAALGESDFLAMVVSTGVGGGIVSEGRLIDGASGNAGHIGHVIVEPDGRPCGCGGRGCLEAEASGTAIAALTGAPPAEAGPAVIERTGRLVGRAVASVANLLDLRLAVIGGSVALGYGQGFFAAAQDELEERARLDYSVGARIIPTGLGPTGGLIGAAALAFR